MLVWNNIRDDLVKLMEGERDSRLERERYDRFIQCCRMFQRVYQTWHTKQPNKHILPRAIDLMRRIEVRAMVEQDNTQGNAEPDFKVFFDNFRVWSAEWKVECDEKLRGLIRTSEAFKNEIPKDVDPLPLASVVFTCLECSIKTSILEHIEMPPLYPEIMTHDCLYPEITDESSIEDPYERAVVAVSKTATSRKHTFWTCEKLTLETHWSKRMEKIITAFNKDPKTVTREEMDAVNDVRISCYKCRPVPLDDMTWRNAVSRSHLPF